MEGAGYVASGRFRADIERALGEALIPRPGVRRLELALDAFPPEVQSELTAFHALVEGWSVPKLCVLCAGDLCPVPDLTGEGRDEVLEDWFSGDEDATDFAMTAVDVVNGGGGFYVLLHPDGRMGLLCEDPYSFDPLPCTLPAFLSALVAAHGAACASGLDEARAELERAVDPRTAKLLLTFAARLTPEAADRLSRSGCAAAASRRRP